MAAAVVTTTETTYPTVKKVKFAWTSADTGVAAATTTEYYSGKIEGLTTVPGAAAAQPTNGYGVAVTDADGVDVLMGGGATRSNAATEHVLSASLGCVVASKLTLAITAAGDTKSGVVYLFIR